MMVTNMAPLPPRAPPPWMRGGSLYHHTFTAFLLLPYLVLLVVPWVATCILDKKPISGNSSSYDYPRGMITAADVKNVNTWMEAIRVMNTITNIATVPVISAVLSHAAVVYVQRRRPGQTLNVRQLLSLADTSWAWMPPLSAGNTALGILGAALLACSKYDHVAQLERGASVSNKEIKASFSIPYRHS